MENGVVVVAIDTVLQKVARCERCLGCEELEGDVAAGGVEDAGGGGLGLEVVEGGHDGWMAAALCADWSVEKGKRDVCDCQKVGAAYCLRSKALTITCRLVACFTTCLLIQPRRSPLAQ